VDHIDIEPSAWQLHEWYRSGVFEIDVGEIAGSARKQLLGKLKSEKKVAEVLQKIAETLTHLNQPIPAIGNGIARFDGHPPPGFVFALQRFIKENSTEQFRELVKNFGGIGILYRAALALSIPGDNLIAILSMLHTLPSAEFNKRSKANKQIAENPRGELNPLKAFLRQHISNSEEETTKEIYNKVVTGQPNHFGYKGDDEAEITVYETTEKGSDGRLKIGCMALFFDKKHPEGKGRIDKTITYETFGNYCSEIRQKI